MTPDLRPAPTPVWTRVGRLVVIGAVLLAGAYVLRLYFGLARGPEPAKAPPPGIEDLPARALAAAVPAGPWSLGDQPWDLRSRDMSQAEALAWLDGPAPPAPGRPANPLEAALLALVKARAKHVTGPDGFTVYALDQPALRARAVCRHAGGEERLVAARAAFPEGGHWRALELRPAAGVGRPVAARLLPWPAGAEALAVRRDEAGATVAEMVRVPRSLPALLGELKAAGWAVARDDRRLTCRGPSGQAVQVWVTSEGRSETVILAVRFTETQP